MEQRLGTAPVASDDWQGQSVSSLETFFSTLERRASQWPCVENRLCAPSFRTTLTSRRCKSLAQTWTLRKDDLDRRHRLLVVQRRLLYLFPKRPMQYCSMSETLSEATPMQAFTLVKKVRSALQY